MLNERKIDYFFAKILSIVGILFFLAAVGIVGLQIYAWLYRGTWVPFPLVLLFGILSDEAMHNLDNWLGAPQSWVGVAKIVGWCLTEIPLSIAFIGLGFGAISWADDFKPKEIDIKGHESTDQISEFLEDD